MRDLHERNPGALSAYRITLFMGHVHEKNDRTYCSRPIFNRSYRREGSPKPNLQPCQVSILLRRIGP